MICVIKLQLDNILVHLLLSLYFGCNSNATILMLLSVLL